MSINVQAAISAGGAYVRLKQDREIYTVRCEYVSQHHLQCFCFLNASRYLPVEVDHGTGIPGTGTFLLHQGIQRRIGVTLMHDPGSTGVGSGGGGGKPRQARRRPGGRTMIWQDVRELVAGRVRSAPDWRAGCPESAVLSLSLLPAHYIQPDGDDRSSVFWISLLASFDIFHSASASRHNSKILIAFNLLNNLKKKYNKPSIL